MSNALAIGTTALIIAMVLALFLVLHVSLSAVYADPIAHRDTCLIQAELSS